MAIRLREVDGRLVAICAARSVEKPGDVYLDDAAHMALSRKFWQDYPQAGPTPEPWVVEATEREESNNAGRDWWDRQYGQADTAGNPLVWGGSKRVDFDEAARADEGER